GAEDAEGAGDQAAVAALAPAAGTAFSVEVGPTAEEIAAAEAAEREAAEQAAQEQAAQDQAEQEQAEAQQDESADSEEQTETREDDSAETSSRSNEREEPAEDEPLESSADESRSSERSESSSSEEQEESAPAPSAAKGSSILATARSGIGTPYVYGGTSPSGWDCSGFVQWVYAQHGISLPRGAGDQAAAGTVIPRSEARPGDLVYKPGHIGIYAGGNQFVDAGNSRVDTSERNIYSGSWTFIRIGG
ncbi:hydrolase, partial [Brachybacterium sp. HMSC06H03]|uniref:C40 family peptidase n=1 Tax=Brachybacterium sp. HMSC06H03 TaxID=1581127 RepID=UPI0008A34997